MPTRYERVPPRTATKKTAAKKTAAKKTAASAPPPPATTPAVSSSDLDAGGIIAARLEEAYGLGSLGAAAWTRYLETGSVEQVFSEIESNAAWTNNAFANRYPGIAEMRKAGRAISAGQYLQVESSFRQIMRGYGLPAGFYDDPTDFAKLISADVSPKELDDRLSYATQVVATDPRGQELRDQLGRLYGMSNADGLAVAYWIDPDRGADLIKRQYLAGEAAAASQRTGFGSLTVSQAEKVATAGVDPSQAQDAFSSLADLNELRTGMVGDSGSQGASADEMIDATFTGSADAKAKIQKEQGRRVAQFRGGGGYAGGSAGLTGLGSAGG